MSVSTTKYELMNEGLFAVCGKRKSGALVPIHVGCHSADSARDQLVRYQKRTFDCPLVVAQKVGGRYVEAGVDGETLGPEDVDAIQADEAEYAKKTAARGRKRA